MRCRASRFAGKDSVSPIALSTRRTEQAVEVGWEAQVTGTFLSVLQRGKNLGLQVEECCFQSGY